MFFQLCSFFRYKLSAQGAHLLHSPFVFRLYSEVIRSNDTIADPEIFRKELKQASVLIEQVPIGAPSKVFKQLQKVPLKYIASVSLMPAKYASLIYRLAAYFKPAQILELGTSAGITTLYMSFAALQAKVHTIEGNPGIAQVAAGIFQKSERPNITLHQGLFEEKLPEILDKFGSPDFVFLDGDHRSTAVLQNLSLLIPRMPEHSVLIIDDIYWNADMKSAWEQIKQMPEVTVTIDLFRLGIVFIKKNQAKQHFILRF